MFSLPEQTDTAFIDTATHEVFIEVLYGTGLTALVPTIQVSAGAVVDPPGDVASDFSSPATYAVTAEDGITVQDWIITVSVVAPKTETDITAFSLNEQAGPATIDTFMHTVAIDVPFGTDVTALAPTIEVSAGASIDPASGVAADFSSAVVYSVTAEDGVSSQDWTVNVLVLANSETDIVAFTLAEQTNPAAIDAEQHTVAIEVLKETDLKTLVPTIEVSSGASIDPASGVSVDFSAPASYLVTAEDGVTTQNWVVTVSVDPAVSLGDEQEAGMFRIYPNPAHDVLFVELSVTADLFIKDVLGRLVYTEREVSGITRIPLSDFKGGLYFAEVQSGYTRIVTKVLVE